MVSICPLLWQRDVKPQQTNKQMKGHSESAYFAKLDLQTEWLTLYIDSDKGQGHNQLVLMTQMKGVQLVEYYLRSILLQ